MQALAASIFLRLQTIAKTSSLLFQGKKKKKKKKTEEMKMLAKWVQHSSLIAGNNSVHSFSLQTGEFARNSILCSWLQD